ncbi:MAG: 6-phosphogluconolactonase [Actinomycetota bacterium]|nr:6-phosphogluconolactonase [Actinomycetota bacterium]
MSKVLPLEVAPDAVALARLAVRHVIEAADAALDERGRFTLAVSGGTTPKRFFEELTHRPLPWRSIHVFQVDERVAPPGHSDRNLAGLTRHLVERVPIPAANVHPMPVEAADLAAAAADYAAELREVCGPEGVLDLVHLGLGDDGHTASWPPGDPVVDVTDADVAVIGPFRGYRRMTLTPPAVNRAGRILWLVDGAGKAPVLARLLDGDPTIPASRVRREGAVIVARADAAPGKP